MGKPSSSSPVEESNMTAEERLEDAEYVLVSWRRMELNSKLPRLLLAMMEVAKSEHDHALAADLKDAAKEAKKMLGQLRRLSDKVKAELQGKMELGIAIPYDRQYLAAPITRIWQERGCQVSDKGKRGLPVLVFRRPPEGGWVMD